jgi:ribonuclease BN (tRNA processing enzyme)
LKPCQSTKRGTVKRSLARREVGRLKILSRKPLEIDGRQGGLTFRKFVLVFIHYSQGSLKMVEVIILGSGTGVPSLKRGSPGLVVVTEGSRTLVDSGPGTLRRMLEAGFTYHDIDLLLYTHIHPDHVSDLVPFLFASKYSDLPRKKDLWCAGGPGFRRYFNKIKRVYGSWIDSEFYRFTIKELQRRPLIFHDVKISAKPMVHLPESVGYRIEFKDGKTLAISGDTDYCTSLVELAAEVDLLVLECSFPNDKKVEGHLIPSLAGRIALESRCKKLLLTHFYPECDRSDILKECREVYSGDITLGEDLMRVGI